MISSAIETPGITFMHVLARHSLYGDSVAFGEAWEGLSFHRRRAVSAAF
jgi:hypothetical protein